MTVIVNVGAVVTFAAGMKPESNPLWPFVLDCARGVHGSANELCVAVWFFCMNWNVTVSPICALMFAGENVNFPGPPTTTW